MSQTRYGLNFIEGKPLLLANWPLCTIQSRAYQLLHWPSCTVSVEGLAFYSTTFSPHQDNTHNKRRERRSSAQYTYGEAHTQYTYGCR